MSDKLLTVSLSPHVAGKFSVKKIMYGVIVALLPALFISVYIFGVSAARITLIAVISAVLCEYVIQKFILMIKPSIDDGSAIITGILLAFNLPSNIPWWIVVIGSVVAIGVAKMSFGGIGNNPFNPALVGRVFLLISFPVQMTSWPKPFAYLSSKIDGITAATPLAILKESESIANVSDQLPTYIDLFIGNIGGCIGEVSAFALILGFIYMLYKKIITWHIPISMVGTIAIFTGILWYLDSTKYTDPLFHILTGGVTLGAIFMATDMVTSPMTNKGMIIFGIGIGFITVIIRVFGAYPEGVSFAILIMNAFVPLLNRCCKPKRFGE